MAIARVRATRTTTTGNTPAPVALTGAAWHQGPEELNGIPVATVTFTAPSGPLCPDGQYPYTHAWLSLDGKEIGAAPPGDYTEPERPFTKTVLSIDSIQVDVVGLK